MAAMVWLRNRAASDTGSTLWFWDDRVIDTRLAEEDREGGATQSAAPQGSGNHPNVYQSGDDEFAKQSALSRSDRLLDLAITAKPAGQFGMERFRALQVLGLAQPVPTLHVDETYAGHDIVMGGRHRNRMCAQMLPVLSGAPPFLGGRVCGEQTCLETGDREGAAFDAFNARAQPHRYGVIRLGPAQIGQHPQEWTLRIEIPLIERPFRHDLQQVRRDRRIDQSLEGCL